MLVDKDYEKWTLASYSDNSTLNKETLTNALWNLLRELKWNGNKEFLENHFFRFSHNIEVVDILNTIRELGYDIHKVEMNIDHLDNHSFPSLFISRDSTQIDDQIYIILSIEGDNIHAFHVNDNQKISIPKESDIKGEFYFFQQSETLKKSNLTDEKEYRNWIISLIRRFISIVKYNIFLTSISTFTSILMPLYIMNVYDRVVTSKDNTTLITLTVGILFAVGLDWFCKLKRAQNSSWLAIRLDHIITTQLFKKILLLIPSQQEISDPIIQQARVNYFKQTRDFIAGNAGQIIYDLFFVPIYIIVIALLGGPIALVPLGVIFAYIVFCWFIYAKIKYSNQEQVSRFNRNDHINEFIEQLRALKNIGMINKWNDRYNELSGDYSYKKYKSSFYISSIENFSYTLSILSAVSTLVIGIFSVWNESLTIGALIALMMFIWRIIQPLQVTATTFGKLIEINDSLKRIHAIFKIHTEDLPSPDDYNATIASGDVEFDNVGVKFQGQKEVILSGLSFKVPEGSLVTVSGKLGCGKSTLIKLINSTIRPQMGRIKIGGTEIQQINPIILRKSIGYISEEMKLFNYTIKENFKLIDHNISEQEIIEYLVDVGCWRYVKDLHNGLEFKISSNGENLPINIRFSLSMAINLVKKPKIFLIDRVPDDLLNSKNYKLLEHIKNKFNHITFFIITNRKDIIKESKYSLLFIKRGLVAFGPPSEIINLEKESELEII